MSDAKARFLAKLQEEAAALQAFISLLKEEQQFLVESHTDGIAGTTERKDNALRRLAELGAARHSQWIAIGAGKTDDDFRQWIARQSAEIVHHWSGLIDAATAAKELNRINGMLIGRGLAQNQNAIQVLGGGSGQQFYGRNGQSTSTVATRSLVSG